MRSSFLPTLFLGATTWCAIAQSVAAIDCFKDGQELRNAVIQFTGDGCSDDNNCNNDIVQKYGWPIGTWCVSEVTNMEAIFYTRSSFDDDISKWNVSAVNDMSWMFHGAELFNRDLSSWDVSSVTTMFSMFEDAATFNQDLSSWDVSSVTNMRDMFRDALLFNQDLSSWDVSSVKDMGWMFANTNSFNRDLSSWDVSSLTDTSDMFAGAKAFNQDLCSWGTKLPKNENIAAEMFPGSGCTYTTTDFEAGGPFCASTCGVSGASSVSTVSGCVATLLSVFLVNLFLLAH
ncbi:unnamed protein product [Cylindrotheca closterium]|uniref:BspA family leucine-rich repeat surface protein n=1 Tax=Cylindrotheca closterium TaxID=2856 RepID=A0AAD2JNR3_9STRA|nr:unnamed protein product [Cylindrotheca closterium]